MAVDDLERLRSKVRVRRDARAFSPEWARSLRHELELSLADIAGALGVDPSVVSRGERGFTTPNPDLAARWVDLLRDLQRGLGGTAA
jgi:transcriptional regulator with XRE-family HTH domain